MATVKSVAIKNNKIAEIAVTLDRAVAYCIEGQHLPTTLNLRNREIIKGNFPKINDRLTNLNYANLAGVIKYSEVY